jgi:hypothetical protein
MRAEAEARADAGLAFLKENEAKYEQLRNWPKRVDLVSLDMSSGYYCVLGQLMGHYSDGAEHLGITSWEGEELGLFVPYDFDRGPRARDEDYALLTKVWKEKVTALQES